MRGGKSMDGSGSGSLNEFIARLDAMKDLVSELDKTILDIESRDYLLDPPKKWLRDVEKYLAWRHQIELTAGFALANAEEQLSRVQKLVEKCGPKVLINKELARS